MAQLQQISSHQFTLQRKGHLISPCKYRNNVDEIPPWPRNRWSLKWKCYSTSRVTTVNSSTKSTTQDQEKAAFENNINDTTLEKRYSDEDEEAEKLQMDSDYIVVGNGWKIRRMVVEEEGEIRKVAEIQAEAFHIPTLFFNDVFFQFFKAEVLSGLLYRLRNSPSDRYACLVAVPDTDDDSVSKSQQELVGVVDVTVLRDQDVVRHLDGAKEYLYVSGIAVSLHHRRKKVATALLKACEVVSVSWGYDNLVLRAYEDDWGARTLYTNAGYKVVSGDPIWLTLIGRKRRILMIKCCS